VAALLRQPTHALRATLLEPEKGRNRKSMLACAQTVDGQDSLWKGKEKAAEIQR
jgi:hypothetical protein